MKRYAVTLFAALAVASVAACGSDPNTLGGPQGGPANGGGGGGGGTGGGTPGNGQPGSDTQPGATPAPVKPGDNAPPPGVADNKAKSYFVQTVYPELMTTCGGCHSPPGSAGAPTYLSKTSASDAYASVEARGYIIPDSMLIKKGSHEGPALTAQEQADVTNWLLLEQQVRGSQAPVNIMSKLGNCVDATKFNAIGLQNLRTIRRNGENANNCTGCNNSPCQGCHESGEYVLHSNFGKLGQTTLQALQANGTSPEGIYLISKYVTTNGTNLVPGTGLKDKATAVATGAPYSHPMFTITPAMDTALQAFAADIVSKYNAKTCGQ